MKTSHHILHSFLLSAIAVLLSLSALAEVSVDNVTAKQRYPWNGLVDITCSVSGIDGATNGLKFAVAAVHPDSGYASSVSHVRVVRNGTTNSTDLAVSSNGDYRLVWDARADLGEVRYSNMVVRVSAIDRHGEVQLWAGGPIWAEMNVGAEEPWEYGLYFWWGDTVGYRRYGSAWVASDGSSQDFSFTESNTPTYGKFYGTLLDEGWITANGVLVQEHDAAHVHWGGSWRMPTKDELSALNNNCDCTWMTQNGISGYVVRGRGDYAANSIFLPAAGDGGGTSLYGAGSNGSYWSSVRDWDGSQNHALGLRFSSDSSNTLFGSYIGRSTGCAVRPVQGFHE